MALEAAIIGPMRRATRRAADAGATNTATTSRLPRPWTATSSASAMSTSSATSTTSARTPSARRAQAIEADRQQPGVQQREHAEDDHRQPGGEREVGVRHAEDVAEEQALQPRRRGGRQREQDAGAEQRGHHHRDGGVAADGRHLPGEADRERRDEQARGAAEQQRQAREGGDDEPRQQRVRQRLGAVGEVVEDDPAPQRAAAHAEQRDLEQRAATDRVGPRIGQRVQHGEHQW